MTESLYWYDLETTGTDPILDRPIQFAGIRTDLHLNEIAPPDNFFGRPGRDVIPAPGAILVTGILMSEVEQDGLIEREFAARMLAVFSVPQTCVVGFNNLRFDDEFTRQMLYRNFHDPYTREWRSGNSRWDVIDLFRAASALRPAGFNWPTRDDGLPSFRLEDLAHANGQAHVDAHDALADVRATIAVTRKLKDAQPKLYEYAFQLRDKRRVLEQLYPLGKRPVVHVSSMFPASRGCTALVLPLCQHPTNQNAIICFDLSQSPDGLLGAGREELARLLFTRNADLTEDDERVALKSIHINRSPFVAPLSTLDQAAANRLGIDLKLSEARAALLTGSPGLVEKVQDVFASHRFDDNGDPDFQLYGGGFFSASDRAVMDELTETTPEQLARFEGRFQDPRLDEMLFRYRGRNYPEQLSEDERNRWSAYRQQRWQTSRSIDSVLQEISALKASTDGPVPMLDDLARYVASLTRD